MDECNEILEQLQDLIGMGNALKVFELFQGESIYFPKRVTLGVLYGEIYRRLKEGASYRELGDEYGYTQDYIRKIERRCILQERAARRANQAAADTWLPKPRCEVRPPAPQKPKVFYLGELFDE